MMSWIDDKLDPQMDFQAVPFSLLPEFFH